uniref:Uncharacterized protein n=1 Tax=Parascaris equorum TaxID=6256 RepID=A0A914R344_PAREQ
MNVMRSQKMSATSGDYSHNTTPQRYHTNTIQNIYSAQTQASNDVIDTTSRPSASVDDFSDMPRLIPFHQMEEASSPFEEEAPQMENLSKANKCSEQMATSQSVDDVPKIAITPAMNVNELVEQIISHMDAEQRKQFATVIKSKVETCEEVERAEILQRAESSTDDHHTVGSEATFKENSRRSGSRRRGQADSSNERHECSQQSTSSQEGSHRTEHNKQREVEKHLSKGGDEVRTRKRHLRDGVERMKKSETPAKSEQIVSKRERAGSEKPFNGDGSKRDGKDQHIEGELESEEAGERVKRKEEGAIEELKSGEEEELREQLNEREEEEARERLRAYRIGVKRKLNEQLKSVIERVEK